MGFPLAEALTPSHDTASHSRHWIYNTQDDAGHNVPKITSSSIPDDLEETLMVH